MIKISSYLLLLCSILSLALALSPTLQKKHIFVSPDNYLSQDLYQTRNGIISHSIEQNPQNQSNYFSQYLLLDIQSREATRILADIVSACEFDITPAFQHLHYHVQTDSLVYFCPKNTSLLILNQSSYSLEATIPINNVNDTTWENARLTTDGQNVVVLGMGPLFTEVPQDSILVKVDMQTRNVTQQISFDLGSEFVVAFVASKNGAYIATSTVQCSVYRTVIYSLVTIGNTYNLTQIADFKAYRTDEAITKLFAIGNYIVVNNQNDLYFLNRQGSTIQKAQVGLKNLTGGAEYSFLQPVMTSHYDGKYIDIFSSRYARIERYSAVEDALLVKPIGSYGSYGDLQVAYGNLTSEDLMFTLDSSKTSFTIFDPKTLNPIYTTFAGFTDLMLTSKTYSVVQANNVYIFDLSNETLIAKVPIKTNYYYSKEQNVISFLNQTDSITCLLQHVSLVTGSAWSTFTPDVPFCNYSISALTITDLGNPEYVLSFNQSFIIHTQALGFIRFDSPGSISDLQVLNFNFDSPDYFYFYDADQENNQVMAGYYGFYTPAKRYITVRRNNITNVSSNKGLFSINATRILALSNDTLTLISDTSSTTRKYSTLGDWNSAGLFKDSTGKDYAILSNDGSNPLLWADEGFDRIPGFRRESIKAKVAGSQSYWISDAPSSSIGLVRFYDASISEGRGKTVISM